MKIKLILILSLVSLTLLGQGVQTTQVLKNLFRDAATLDDTDFESLIDSRLALSPTDGFANITNLVSSATAVTNQWLIIADTTGNLRKINMGNVLVAAGGGAFVDADPIVPNTTTFDMALGTGAVNSSKLSIDGDADQVQLTVQGNATQTDSTVIIENSGGTEVLTIEDDGTIFTAVGIDAIGAISIAYGSADVTDHTFTTDGTGTAEFVIPAGSIDSTEILDGTIVAGDLAAGVLVGNALDTELIFNNSGTLDGSVLTTDGTDVTLNSGSDLNITDSLVLDGAGGGASITTSGADPNESIVLTPDGTGIVSITSDIAIGTTPASTGEVRLPNTGTISARNAADSGDVQALTVNASDQVIVGDASATVRIEGGGGALVQAGTQVFLDHASSAGIFYIGEVFRPNSDNITDLGASTHTWKNAYIGTSVRRGTTAGITASTTQTQGNGALTTEVNEVSIVANDNDTNTLPTASVGWEVTIVNNDATEYSQLFPASGDNLGEGVDTATDIGPSGYRKYIAYDATNWEQVAKGPQYGQISAESNVTATTISASSTDFSNAVQVTVFDTDGVERGADADNTNDHIEVKQSGVYCLHIFTSFSGGANDTYSYAFFKNNGATKISTRVTRKLGAGGDVGASGIECLASLDAGDTVELWAQNETDTDNLTFEDLVMYVSLTD